MARTRMPEFVETNTSTNLARRSAFLRDVTIAARLATPLCDFDRPEYRHLDWPAALYHADMWCDPSFMQHYHGDDFSDLPEQVHRDLTTCVSQFIRATTPPASKPHADKDNRVLAATHLITIFDILKPALTTYWNELRKD